jgi:DNA-binding NarL/FixJ family response regulator
METMIADPNTALTPRQIELLALYASGKGIRQIAEIKFLSYNAVQQSLATARERVGVATLTQLCAICLDTGVIERNGVGFKPVQEERVIGE